LPPLNFGLSECCQKIFFSSVHFRQKAKIWAENLHFGKIWGKLKILSTHVLLCRKFAAVCQKIATSCRAYFSTDDAAVTCASVLSLPCTAAAAAAAAAAVQLLTRYATVVISRITALAHPSVRTVRLSVPYDTGS